MVLFVECDGATNDACMNGNTSSCSGQGTLGNFVSGTPYPLCNPPSSSALNAFGSGYSLQYIPAIYLICPDKKTTKVNGYTSAQLYNKMMQKCPPATDVASYTTNEEFVIYPNPSPENITISATFNSNENLEIIISDIMGKTLMDINENAASGNLNKNIDLNNFSSGIYFITLKSRTRVEVKKFVKE